RCLYCSSTCAETSWYDASAPTTTVVATTATCRRSSCDDSDSGRGQPSGRVEKGRSDERMRFGRMALPGSVAAPYGPGALTLAILAVVTFANAPPVARTSRM